ncbi:MAG TPA: cytochrome c [Baekduia sp.]|uniref:c-type cytochrome n=1 Tax=Baekduia sp. TaxID=2600305 RepID=UPI002CBBB4EE|nr:cytochrome c [Baekduia sp.]HMJ36119.1 cytochrome c [Baekduia sp.]
MIGTVVFILVFLAIGLSVVMVAMRSGRAPRGSQRESRAASRAWGLGIGLVILVVGLGLPALVLAFNHDDHAKRGPGGVDLNAAQVNGRSLFAKNCSTCHTLAASNAVGRVGPNLDNLVVGVQNKQAFVLDAIKNGRAKGNGQMPAGLLYGQEAKDVASYIAAVAGR